MKIFILSFIFLFYSSLVSFSQDFPFPIIWQKSADSLEFGKEGNIVISSDGKYIYSMPNNYYSSKLFDTLNKLDAKTANIIERIPMNNVRFQKLKSIKFSPDNKWMYGVKEDSASGIFIKSLENKYEEEILYFDTLKVYSFDLDYKSNLLYSCVGYYDESNNIPDYKSMYKHKTKILKINLLNKDTKKIVDSIPISQIFFEPKNNQLVCALIETFLVDKDKWYYINGIINVSFFDVTNNQFVRKENIFGVGYYGQANSSISSMELSPSKEKILFKNSLGVVYSSNPLVPNSYTNDILYDINDSKKIQMMKYSDNFRNLFKIDDIYLVLNGRNLQFCDIYKNIVQTSYYNKSFDKLITWDNSSDLLLMKIKTDDKYSIIAFDAQYIMDIAQNENFNLIELYPNPCVDKIRLNVNSENTDIISCKITNLFGEQKKNISIENPFDFSKEIDVSDLESGAYFIIVQSQNSNKIIKFIKN